MRGWDRFRMFTATLAMVSTLLVVLGPGGHPAAAQVEVGPVVPFGLYSAHWDHHWFAWLPRHPASKPSRS